MKRRETVRLLPLYLWTLALVAAPMIYIFVLSLMTRAEGIGATAPLTLSNYARLFEDTNVRIFLRSLWIALITTVFTLGIGYPFAYAMAARPAKQRSLLLLLIIVPFWTSALLRTYGWMLFLRSNGLLNGLLAQLGLPVTKLLYNEGATVFGMIYTFLPFMILPIYTSLEKQDLTLREAARDLGASPLRTFMTVVLPLTTPGVVSGCTMVFVPSIGMFFISDLMGGGTDMLLGNLINHYLHGGRNWPLGAALSMILVAMTALTLTVYRRFADGEQLGVF